MSAHVDETKEGSPTPRISSDTLESSDLKPPLAPPPPSTSADNGEPSEEESEGVSAFNPETGEINWDCPCLGGMAHGPCGLQFREAFSCFVFSEQEPKGIDCIEKFRLMQECFREHPDVYGEGGFLHLESSEIVLVLSIWIELIGDDETDEASDSQSPADSPSVQTDMTELPQSPARSQTASSIPQ